ncbi:hypothetical protein NEOLI_000692 [Neolecta irregularis DAH-3]|uniref:WW domain-containing protein n=1 Tax=Neolecta irregularis (strain DAH-3) TaxID=1198029 RepID=A0A1U7LW26_NEOID|nr:hypothetical protein NEOLI_000692 [Neolecta irregularis DAH-3]|eukprot:OLL26886.1 hypothetical protein NEOLI_000692 [Neolecta irregularis DAH-3]
MVVVTLPVGWHKGFSTRCNREYYISPLGKTQWNIPNNSTFPADAEFIHSPTDNPQGHFFNGQARLTAPSPPLSPPQSSLVLPAVGATPSPRTHLYTEPHHQAPSQASEPVTQWEVQIKHSRNQTVPEVSATAQAQQAQGYPQQPQFNSNGYSGRDFNSPPPLIGAQQSSDTWYPPNNVPRNSGYAWDQTRSYTPAQTAPNYAPQNQGPPMQPSNQYNIPGNNVPNVQGYNSQQHAPQAYPASQYQTKAQISPHPPTVQITQPQPPYDTLPAHSNAYGQNPNAQQPRYDRVGGSSGFTVDAGPYNGPYVQQTHRPDGNDRPLAPVPTDYSNLQTRRNGNIVDPVPRTDQFRDEGFTNRSFETPSPHNRHVSTVPGSFPPTPPRPKYDGVYTSEPLRPDHTLTVYRQTSPVPQTVQEMSETVRSLEEDLANAKRDINRMSYAQRSRPTSMIVTQLSESSHPPPPSVESITDPEDDSRLKGLVRDLADHTIDAFDSSSTREKKKKRRVKLEKLQKNKPKERRRSRHTSRTVTIEVCPADTA